MKCRWCSLEILFSFEYDMWMPRGTYNFACLGRSEIGPHVPREADVKSAVLQIFLDTE
jgi:hypothetical protein